MLGGDLVIADRAVTRLLLFRSLSFFFVSNLNEG